MAITKQVPEWVWWVIAVIVFLMSYEEGQRNYQKGRWMTKNKGRGRYKLVYKNVRDVHKKRKVGRGRRK